MGERRFQRLLRSKLSRTGMTLVPPDVSRMVINSVRQSHLGRVGTLFFINIGRKGVPGDARANKVLSRLSESFFRRRKIRLTPKPGRLVGVREFCLCLGVAGPKRGLVLSCDSAGTGKRNVDPTCLVKDVHDLCPGLRVRGSCYCPRGPRTKVSLFLRGLMRRARGRRRSVLRRTSRASTVFKRLCD